MTNVPKMDSFRIPGDFSRRNGRMLSRQHGALEGMLNLESQGLRSDPGFAISYLCDLGQVTTPLWASVSLFVKEG